MAVAIIGSVLYLPSKPRGDSVQALPPDYVVFNIDVRQSNGQVSFEFYQFGVKDGTPQRSSVAAWSVSVYLPGGAPTIWKIESLGESRITQAVYGKVPAGFRQMKPSDGTAPALEIGRTYYVSALGGGGLGAAPFVYRGP
jgi:hypothetical protein